MNVQGLTHTLITPMIHEFVLHDVESQTIEQLFIDLGTILTSTPPQGTIKLLIRASAIPSIYEMVTHNRKLLARYPYRFQARVAVVYAPSLQFDVLNRMSSVLRQSANVRLFPQEQSDLAFHWLSR